MIGLDIKILHVVQDSESNLMKTKLTIFILFFLGTLLTACAAPEPEEAAMNGRVLLWHEWQGVEAQLLNTLITEFRRLHPGVDVITVPVSAGTIVNRFQDRSDSALGPDIMLLDAGSVYQLAEAGLIEDISGQIALGGHHYLSAAQIALQKGDELFGIPFAVDSQVLFYNREMVQSPPETLAELQDRVADGERIAMDANLMDAIWGLGAFGGSLFDDQGELTLSQGGFINWLDFLQQAQAQPGFILDTNIDRLREMFVAGETAYYVGPSSDLPLLRAAFADIAMPAAETNEEAEGDSQEPALIELPLEATDLVGVASLPVGPNDWQPSPVLQTDAFVFSRVSSPQEQALALELAEFLTNPQQQLRLAQEDIGRMPASAELRLNLNMPEAVLALIKQSRTAVSIPYQLRPQWDVMVQEEGEFENRYTRALQGILTTSQLIDESNDQIETKFDTGDRDPDLLCPDQVEGEPRTLTLWHALPERETGILQAIPASFEALCPGIKLEIFAQDPAEIIDNFIAEAQDGGGPDILIESSRWSSQLAERELIADLSDHVRPVDLEPLIPEAADSMRFKQRLYGIPQLVSVLALIYNTDMIDSPPASLDELLLQVNSERRLALPVRFFYGYWGLNPFGGFDFNSEEGLIEELEGVVPWLTWLQSAQAEPGIDLTFDPAEATDAFVRRQAAFTVAGSWTLSQLREELGDDQFAVAPLPSGPAGLAAPILQVEGIMVSANSEDRIDDALAFSRFLSLPESQAVLLDSGSFVSANVIFNTDESPLLRGFQEAAKLAVEVDENSSFAAMEKLGDIMYEDVLIDGVDPQTAAAEFEAAVEQLAEDQP